MGPRNLKLGCASVRRVCRWASTGRVATGVLLQFTRDTGLRCIVRGPGMLCCVYVVLDLSVQVLYCIVPAQGRITLLRKGQGRTAVCGYL